MTVNTKRTTPKEGCWITEEMQETAAGQGHERSKKRARAGGMVEQEKRQSKANCPEQGWSQEDTRVATEGRPRKRGDRNGTAVSGGTHAGAAEEEPQCANPHLLCHPSRPRRDRAPPALGGDWRAEGAEEMCPDGS